MKTAKNSKKMKIILKKSDKKLGQIGDIAFVNKGYARYFLFPNRFAILATPANIKSVEKQKDELLKEDDNAKQIARKVQDNIENVKVDIIRASGDSGALYGSVTARDLSAFFADKGLDIPPSIIMIKEPIKAVGVFQAIIKLHSDVEMNVKIYIASFQNDIILLRKNPFALQKTNLEESRADISSTVSKDEVEVDSVEKIEVENSSDETVKVDNKTAESVGETGSDESESSEDKMTVEETK
ncbi:MAG: 50S ribosomal protein L9 [Alphaproteobacteria bacterium]|nr:50S ribosomal protein L9 [Alphaproteobacteria bacterium]